MLGVCLLHGLTDANATSPTVQFDLSPLSVVEPIESTESATALPGQRLVVVPLRLSLLVDSPQQIPVERLIVRIRCRNSETHVADYQPRSQWASDVVGTIGVQQNVEQRKNLGITLSGHPIPVLKGSLGGEAASNREEKRTFQRVSPMAVVATSGTIDGGRGVYFKLRRTATQILEGEKRFWVTLAVPEIWRGDLLDVFVVADSLHRPFPGFETQVRAVGSAHFMVATFEADDYQARQAAFKLADAESRLRNVVFKNRSAIRRQASNNLFRQVVTVLDPEQPILPRNWFVRVLRAEVDSRIAQSLEGLPKPVQDAVSQYRIAQRQFLFVDQQECESNPSKS